MIKYFIVADGIERGWIYSRNMTTMKWENPFVEGDVPEADSKLVEITEAEFQAIIDVQDGFREGAEEAQRLTEIAIRKRS